MAFRPFQRLGRALSKFWHGLIEPAPVPTPSPPEYVPQPPRTGNEFPNDPEAQAVYDRILDWRLGRTNRARVAANVRIMTPFERELVMMMDKEAFRQMASVNPHFWYH